MNVIASAETKRKNGRRTSSGVSWRSPHAPPRFFASTKSRLPGMSSTGRKKASGPSSLRSAPSLVPRSRTKAMAETTPKKTYDGRFRAVLCAIPVGGSSGTLTTSSRGPSDRGITLEDDDVVSSSFIFRDGVRTVPRGGFGAAWRASSTTPCRLKLAAHAEQLEASRSFRACWTGHRRDSIEWGDFLLGPIREHLYSSPCLPPLGDLR